MYNVIQMFGVGTIFEIYFWSLLSSKHLFDQKYSKKHNIVKYYYNLK